MKKMIFVLAMMLTLAVTTAQTPNEVVKQVKETTDKIVKSTGDGASVVKTSTNAVSTVYGDGKSAVSNVYNDIKSLAPDAKSAMKDIVSALKATSNKVWDLLVKQQLVWSWCYLFGELLSLYAIFRFYKQLNVAKTEKNDTGDTLAVNWIQTIVTGCIALVLSILSFTHFEAMMTGFINPEFGALRNLVELAQTLR